MPSLSRDQLLGAAVAVAFLVGVLGFLVGSASERPPSEVDVGFLQDMIRHHDQAVEIALIALDRSDEPVIRTFAQEVVIFQRREIGIMETILAGWGQSRTGDETVMEWMGMPMPLEEMPGYADPAEIDSLRAAEGAALDAQFLTMLATHHVGGIQMAAFTADNARSDQVADLATVIVRNQAAEIPEYAATADRLDLPGVPGSLSLTELVRLAKVAQT